MGESPLALQLFQAEMGMGQRSLAIARISIRILLMTQKELLTLALFGLGVYVFRKECGSLVCAVARTLNSRPTDIIGKALLRL